MLVDEKSLEENCETGSVDVRDGLAAFPARSFCGPVPLFVGLRESIAHGSGDLDLEWSFPSLMGRGLCERAVSSSILVARIGWGAHSRRVCLSSRG